MQPHLHRIAGQTEPADLIGMREDTFCLATFYFFSSPCRTENERIYLQFVEFADGNIVYLVYSIVQLYEALPCSFGSWAIRVEM